MTHASADTRTALRARTFPVEAPADLLDRLGADGFAWLEGGRGFVTAGVAATVAMRGAPSLLAAIKHERANGVAEAAGPRAVGALPFDGSGLLTVPSMLVGCDEHGSAWCTLVGTDELPPGLHVAHPRPSAYRVEAVSSEDEWHEAVHTVLAAIEQRKVHKVVLARAVDIEADVPVNVRDVLSHLLRTQPGCIVYAHDGFVGASPELLVRVRGGDVVARPLAGTGVDAVSLLSSSKDAREHRVVVDAVVAALATCCADVQSTGPAPLSLTDVTHLATTVRGCRRRDVSVADLVDALHPTPAVGGSPRAAALELIRALEPVPRGFYAGPCGWIDEQGDGEFVVALRGGAIDGARVRLHAGAGIVAGSDPAAEWVETQQKLEPMLRAVIRP